VRKGIFYLFCSRDLDLDPMTFIYELHPYSLEIYRLYKYVLKIKYANMNKVIL